MCTVITTHAHKPSSPNGCVCDKERRTHAIHWRSVRGLGVTVRQIITSLTSHEKDLHSALLLFCLPASVCRSDQVINGCVFERSQHRGEHGVFAEITSPDPEVDPTSPPPSFLKRRG